MERSKVVLVTGVAGYWGGHVAVRLAATPGYTVIGLDAEEPADSLPGIDFIQADIRNPLLAELLSSEQVEVVCHLAFQESERPSEAAFDINVMGTVKLLGACAEAGVRKVVLKSSMEVYGARPDNSAFLTEDQPLRARGRAGHIRDLMEIEAFCNGFQRQTPLVALTVLRFPGIVGTKADTPLTRFLRNPAAPSLLGFNPRTQVIHEDDVVGTIVHVVEKDVPGVYNVAIDEVLTLAQVAALAGKLAVPVVHPLAYWGAGLAGGTGAPLSRFVPIDPDYMRYSCVGDLTRMRESLGYTMRYSAGEALREFAAQQRLLRYLPDAAVLAYDEKRLRDTLERRRRMREACAEAGVREEEVGDNG